MELYVEHHGGRVLLRSGSWGIVAVGCSCDAMHGTLWTPPTVRAQPSCAGGPPQPVFAIPGGDAYLSAPHWWQPWGCPSPSPLKTQSPSEALRATGGMSRAHTEPAGAGEPSDRGSAVLVHSSRTLCFPGPLAASE